MKQNNTKNSLIRRAVAQVLNDFDRAAGLSEDLYIIKADDHGAICKAVADIVEKIEELHE